MPEETYNWLRRNLLLSFEELTRLVRIFQTMGVERLRLTGGEPLTRKGLPVLIEQVASLGLKEIALTTNGILLSQQRDQLFAAGLTRITISLDAVEPKLFKQICQRDDLERVLEGVWSVARTPGLKLDAVMLNGINDNQMIPLLQFAESVGAEVRFIEYMDVGGATQWSSDQVLSQAEMLVRLEREYGRVTSLPGRGSAPATRYMLPSGQTFGIIASTTRPFCASCDRARVTADGQLLTCLYSMVGKDLRKLLRGESTDSEIGDLLAGHWSRRMDRGAEERVRIGTRGPLADALELQRNLHLEMHTRGG
jgi:GTP 3',8-cyclase